MVEQCLDYRHDIFGFDFHSGHVIIFIICENKTQCDVEFCINLK